MTHEPPATVSPPRGRLLDAAGELGQLSLVPGEEERFLTRQLITYIGNKRALLRPIRAALEDVRARTGLERMRILDAFSGSGVVARMFKQYASELVVNDVEDYARAVSECYLTNRHAAPWPDVREAVASLNRRVDEGYRGEGGFIRRLYAPGDETRIQPGERVFYTPENARRLDAYRALLDDVPAEVRRLLMGPLLSEASVHANTAGVFKGFYKDRETGIGKFGGSGADALDRIMRKIELEPPVLSRFDCDYEIHQADANLLVRETGDFDVAYFDPPYNQHPYGSNYFMLNLLVRNEEPKDLSAVSGIPADWRRSGYNVRRNAMPLLRDLVSTVDARFVILSFNDEGFIPPGDLMAMLEGIGTVTEHREPYTTFRGCRNLRNRSATVTEHVYVVEKG